MSVLFIEPGKLRPNNNVDHDRFFAAAVASGKTSFNASQRGPFPKQTIMDAISSGFLNACHTFFGGEASPSFEASSQTKRDVGSALNTQYDLPNGSVPTGIDFPQISAASLVKFVR